VMNRFFFGIRGKLHGVCFVSSGRTSCLRHTETMCRLTANDTLKSLMWSKVFANGGKTIGDAMRLQPHVVATALTVLE
jgi:hypothetical protein